MPSYKLFTNSLTHPLSQICIASAKHCEQDLQVVIITEDVKKSNAALKKLIEAELVPVLEVEEGSFIFEDVAIAKFFGRLAPEKKFLGATPLEKAQVEMNLQKIKMSLMPNLKPILSAIFGEETDGGLYQNSLKFVKEFLMTLSKQLQGKKYLVGETVTVADVYLAGVLSAAFGTFIDVGLQKAIPNVKSWFDSITKLDSFVAAFGHLKAAQRPIKPLNLTQSAEEKKKEAEQKQQAEEKKKKQAEAAAKPKVEAKPAAPSIDTLPKTDFDLYNYKTYFVNHDDKAGEAMLETKKMFKSEGFADGYSWWHMRYDKYGSEGQVMYKFANLLGGFLQRIDTKLGRYAFGRVIMLGEEPNLDIECVFMFRGQEIPEIMKEHVSYEYFTNKKLDFMGNEDDYNMICQFMSAFPEGEVGLRKVAQVEWFK